VGGYSGAYDTYTVKSYASTGDFNSNAEEAFKGRNPLLINFQPVNNSSSNADTFYLLSESSDNTGAFSSAAVNIAGTNQKTWQLPGSEFFQSKEGFAVQKQLCNHLNFTSAFMDQTRNTIYVIGYAEGGSLILKTTQAFLASTGNPGGATYLIAGPTPNPLSEDFYPNFTNLQDSDSDPVSQTFPNIIGFERNRFVIFYVAQGGNSIKFKILNGTSLSEERTVIDLNLILKTSSSSNVISGLTSVFQESNKTIHLLFWCNNKIFYLSFSSYIESTVDIMPKLQLVSGNFTVDKSSNPLVYDLNQEGYVTLNNDDDDNTDIPQQRPGLALTLKKKNQYLVAWYKDTNNKIVSKTIYPNSKVFDKRVYEVFSQ
jgi:hypothetical protein